MLEKITGLLQPSSGDLVIEIGSGDGALSKHLAQYGCRIIAIEVDADLIPTLESALHPYASAEILCADVLKLDLERLVTDDLQPGQRLWVAGNLPYNIATAIIEHLLSSRLPINLMVFMLQLEVAQRITARPASRQYGYFSVFCQHYAEARLHVKVPPACFVPRPKVTSAVISLAPMKNPLDIGFELSFVELIKAAFSYRRKTIVNSLQRNPSLEHRAADILRLAKIDSRRRAEELSVGDYELLAGIWHQLSQTRIK